MKRVLVVDDEPDAVELIAFNLKAAGFKVIKASSGLEALRLVKTRPPDLIVLDLMLPEVDGLEVCKMLRRESETASIPIIMVTARASEIDRVLGLEFGADDYVTKPFSPRELVLRVKNLVRRSQADAPELDCITIGCLAIDIPRHEVRVNHQPIELTSTEFKLLSILAQRRGRVQTRDQLLRDVWEYDAAMETRTVDTHMRRLREKLGPAACYLGTVRGVGYRLVGND